MAKPNSAFMKPMTLSPELAAVIGKGPMSRTEVTKGLWAYIKKNDLQDPKNKRDIIADEKLKAVFGKPKVNMFEMTKIVSGHLSQVIETRNSDNENREEYEERTIEQRRESNRAEKLFNDLTIMLTNIAIVLVILWAVGFLGFHILGGLIHVLLVLAVVLFLVRIIQGKNPVAQLPKHPVVTTTGCFAKRANYLLNYLYSLYE